MSRCEGRGPRYIHRDGIAYLGSLPSHSLSLVLAGNDKWRDGAAVADKHDSRHCEIMQTALDADPDTLNKHERQIVADVKEYGWFHTSVFGEGKFERFSYSTGFWVSAQIPEILTFGLGKAAHDILWHMFRQGKAGVKYPVRVKVSDLLAKFPAILFPVAKKYYSEFPLSSRWFYRGEEFPCLQLVWPDLNGLFPWEQGFDERFRNDQPDLTEHGWLNLLAN